MKTELVAPAGSFEKLKYAFAYGADAVYAGVPKFSLRARENEFSEQDLAKAIGYTREKGKKIYLTLNIYPHNRKIEAFRRALYQMKELGPDALIISDPGIVLFCREICPDIPLHLSTQANTVNWAAVRFWREQGIGRVILSRELSITEIAEIREKVPEMELEAFVHGAVCVAYSGRCLISNYMNHRDPNQGTCTNSCRWPYQLHYRDSEQGMMRDYFLEEPERPGEYMPVDEDDHGTYIMNSRDLCALPVLGQLCETGVHALKIEGRNKSVYYLSVVIRAYRKALEQLSRGEPVEPGLLAELNTVANRSYMTGFLERNPLNDGQNYEESHSGNQTHTYCGLAQPSPSGKGTKISVRNRFRKGDSLELLTPLQTINFRAERMSDMSGQDITVAHGGGPDIFLDLPAEVPEFSLLRRPKKQEI